MNNSPITSIFGILTAIATILQQAFHDNGIPQTPQEWFMLSMGLATSLGLYFAKDFNVSNSSHPKQEAEKVKSAPPIVPMLLIVGLGLSISACSQVKEIAKMVNPFVGAIESQVAELTAGEYKVAVTKDGKVLYEEIIICTKNEDVLTGCHKK